MAYGEDKAMPAPLAEAQQEVSKIRAMAAERASALRNRVDELESEAKNVLAAANEWAALANGRDAKAMAELNEAVRQTERPY